MINLIIDSSITYAMVLNIVGLEEVMS